MAAGKWPPVKNAAWRVTFPILDADGDLVTGAASDTPDSERSINSGTFTDCSNEFVEIATSSGMYYLDLNASEMNGTTIAIIAKTATAGTKTTPIVVYPVTDSFDEIGGDTASILVDTGTTLQNQVASILVDTGTTLEARVSDVESSLVIIRSDLVVIDSGVTAIETDTGTTLQNQVASILVDTGTTLEARLSDVESSLVIAKSDLVVIDSGVTAIETDTGTTLQNQVASILVDTGTTLESRLSDVESSLVIAKSDLVVIDSGVTAIEAATIAASGAVESSGSNSSTQVQTNLAEATSDHYDVMTILFTSGAEAGQSRLITGYVGGTGVVSWNAALTGTPGDGSTFVILSAGTTADAVWDEILTGASHNIATSAGKRLRQIEQAFTHASGTIATVTNGHTFTLDGGAVATADYYIGDRLQITEGTGAGQSRLIAAYTSGRVVTLDSNFTTSPDTSSLYEIIAADVHVSLSDADLAEGFVATFTNTTTITLDAGAVATADFYVGQLIVFTHGAGKGQAREITAYTSGRVVTMSPALTTAVDTTTTYHVQAMVSVPEIVDELLTTAMTESYAANAAAPTLAQFAFAVHQRLMQFGISGTSLTVRKLDDSTTAFIVTHDDATAPTDAKRV